ncbi:polysaccharide biosynthesis tyrosine autokinase [Kamptonema cortianum]|nr:polysaccharide biosynthesis tyrosine autokinase [Geitlerinema splendidum]MDK3155870.1 polysaccharide biosynthesis tyrosine autokinase [Kamptonema cortianum]
MTTAEQDQREWQSAEYPTSTTLGEFLASIRRNALVFWITLILVIGAGVAISLIMPKAYAAGTEILVEGAPPNSNFAPGPENLLSEFTVQGASYALNTQVELLQSQDVFFQTIQNVGMPMPRTIEELREKYPRVFVRQKGDSSIFIVSIEGPVKEDVQRVAEAYPLVFQQYMSSFRSQALQRGLAFAESRLQAERDSLRQLESELAAFKQQNGVVDSNVEVGHRLTLLSTTDQQLAVAKAEAAAAGAAVKRLETELSMVPRVRDRVSDAFNYQLITENENQLNLLKVSRERLLQVFQPDARDVKEIDAQIRQQEAFIEDMKENLRKTLTESNPEYDAYKIRLSEARARQEAAIQNAAQLEALAGERAARLNQLATLSVQQREFEQKIDQHNRAIAQLEELLVRVQLRDNSLKDPITPLTTRVFVNVSRPNWLINMTLAVVFGLILAVVFSLVRDSTQDRLNSREEAYRLASLSILAHVPERPRSRHPLITNPQTSIAFEAYRVLRSSIGIHAKQHDIKTLTVTSTIKREGKSVIASNLAVAYVLNGQKTILVDANLRNPTVHTLLGGQAQPGLGDVLLGTHTVEQALQQTSVEGLQILSAGTIPANATEAIGSDRMKEVVEELSKYADMVVFDTPHVAGLADAPSIASVTDASILVVTYGKPDKSEFKEAVGILTASSPALLGLVENRVSASEARLAKS